MLGEKVDGATCSSHIIHTVTHTGAVRGTCYFGCCTLTVGILLDSNCEVGYIIECGVSYQLIVKGGGYATGDVEP